jgi:hypothetical protein
MDAAAGSPPSRRSVFSVRKARRDHPALVGYQQIAGLQVALDLLEDAMFQAVRVAVNDKKPRGIPRLYCSWAIRLSGKV